MFTTLANSVSRFFYRQSAGMFILRLVLGLVFVIHGAEKLSDMTRVIAFFGTLGLGAWIAWFIALLEVVGGAALILGVATRFFGALFAIEMVVILFMFGGVFTTHQFELLLAAAALSVALTGSGNWSLYPMECYTCGGIFCDGNQCVFVEGEEA